MNTSDLCNSFKLLGFLLLAMIFCALTACRPGPSPDAELSGPGGPIPGSLKAEGGLSVQVEAPQPDQRELALTWPGSVDPPTSRIPLYLVLPPAGSPQIRLADYRIADGPNLLQSDPDPARHFAITNPVQIEFKGFANHWPIYQVTLLPEFWLPLRQGQDDRHAVVTARLLIEWTEPGTAPSPAINPAGESAFARLISHLVVNPQDLSRWALSNPPLHRAIQSTPSLPPLALDETAQWFKFQVDSAGLYRISPEMIADLGLPMKAQGLSNLAIYHGAQPVPIIRTQIESAQGAAPGIYFYAWDHPTSYSQTNCYWVGFKPNQSLEQASLPGPPPSEAPPQPLTRYRRIERLEQDNQRIIERGPFESIRAIEWFHSRMQSGANVPLDFQPTPAGTAAGSNPLLRLRFRSEGDPFNSSITKVSLYDRATTPNTLQQISFSEDREHHVEIPLDASLFDQTGLGLDLRTIVGPSTPGIDGVWFDWAELEFWTAPRLVENRLILSHQNLDPGLYRLAWDQLNPDPATPTLDSDSMALLALNPATRQIRSLRYDQNHIELHIDLQWQAALLPLASAKEPDLQTMAWNPDLLNAHEPVDYLMITHPLFIDSLAPLIQFHQANGRTVKTANINEIYDYFSAGNLSPQAVNRYLGYIATHWDGGLPDYVLLVGDCTQDFLNLSRNEVRNLVPSHLYQHGPDALASDYSFTTITGDDDLSDLLLGRLSVTSNEDLAQVIKKIQFYDAQPLGPWRARFVYVADNLQNYRHAAEILRNRFSPRSLLTHRIYLDEQPLEDNWYMPEWYARDYFRGRGQWPKSSSMTTRALLEQFEQGFAQLDYVGHGSPNIWTHEHIWFGGDSINRDTQHLDPAGPLSFAANFTCNTGAIDYPLRPWNICISEDMLRAPGGPVGLYVPSGPGTPEDHLALAEHWRRALFAEGIRGFGALSAYSRLRYALENGNESILHMFLLLGDPALTMQRVDQWAELEGLPSLQSPAERTLSFNLPELAPQQGQWIAQLESESGTILLTTQPIQFNSARQNTASLELPEEALAQIESAIDAAGTASLPFRLTVYGWNESQRRDWVASGQCHLGYPYALIESAEIMHDESEPQALVSIHNPTPLSLDNVEVSLFDLRSVPMTQLAQATHSVDARSTFTLRLPVNLETAADPIPLLARLVQPHPPGALTQPDPVEVNLVMNPTDAGAGQSAPTIATQDQSQTPRLKIVPGSIRHEPEYPVEGETVWFHVRVTNQGDAVSEPTQADLFDAPPAEDGRPLPRITGLPPATVPPLAPGRTTEIRLRWDPSVNSGVQDIWIQLMTDLAPDSPLYREQIARYSLLVKTKSKLVVSKELYLTYTREDQELNRRTMHVEIANQGETASRALEIKFFSDPRKRPQDLLGTAHIDAIPAGKASEATLLWENFDPHAKPVVEIRVMGSSQRIGQ